MNKIKQLLKCEKITSKNRSIITLLEQYKQYDFSNTRFIYYTKRQGVGKISDNLIPLQLILETYETSKILQQLDISYILEGFTTQAQTLLSLTATKDKVNKMDKIFEVLDNSDNDFMYIRYNNTKYTLLKINEAYNYVENYKDKYQIDEVLYGDKTYRFILDIETPKGSSEIINIQAIEDEIYTKLCRILAKLNEKGNLLKTYYVQDSTKLQKFRLVTNIATSIQVMKYIVKNLSYESQKYIDVSIYTKNHCLRLPNSYKYVDNKLVKRCYAVPEFKDFLSYTMSDTTNCIYIKTPLMFKIKKFYKVLSDYENVKTDLGVDFDQLRAILSNYYPQSIIKNITFKLKSNSVCVDFNKNKHSCILDKTIKDHDSNLFIYKKFYTSENRSKLVGKCLSHRCKQHKDNNIILYEFPVIAVNEQNKTEEINLIANALEKTNLNINDLPITHNQKYLTKINESDAFNSLEFNDYYRYKNTFIISNMGSGKSNLLEYWFSKYFNNQNILYVSFRKSLTNNMGDRLDLENYQDVKNFKFDDTHKKFICQIESIDKIQNIN